MRKMVCLLLLIGASTAWGQTGCTDSPENPTALLALVSVSGALVTKLRRK